MQLFNIQRDAMWNILLNFCCTKYIIYNIYNESIFNLKKCIYFIRLNTIYIKRNIRLNWSELYLYLNTIFETTKFIYT